MSHDSTVVESNGSNKSKTEMKKQKSSSSNSTGKSITRFSVDDNDDESRNGHRFNSVNKYRMLKQQSSNVSEDNSNKSKESNHEIKVPNASEKQKLDKRAQSTISMTSESSTSTETGTSNATEKSCTSVEDLEQSQHDSLPSALKLEDDDERKSLPEVSVSSNNELQMHKTISKMSLDSMTAALAEGDSNSTSVSSDHSSEFESKSPENDL